jgi:hypothetical protein
MNRAWLSTKRIWNKLFGDGTFDPSMTEEEKQVARRDLARQQLDRERLANEVRVRQGYNGGTGFGP